MTASPPLSIVEQAFPKQWLIGPSPFLRGRDKVVDRLFYGVFHHRRTQLLSGPDGAGKTITLQRLQRRLRGRRTLIALDGNAIEDGQGLLVALCNALEQQPRPAKAIIDACLQARLKALAGQDRAVVLLIDDGDTLSDETLGTIVDWSRGDGERGHYPLTTIISGRPPLAERLTTEPRYQQGDRPGYWLEVALQPLSLVGTGRYLQQRISRAGIRAPGPFDRARTKAIQRQSGGWPGAIDALARDLLQQETQTIRRARQLRSPPNQDEQQPRRNLSGLLLVLLLALVAWWYRVPLLERPAWENRDRVVEWLQEQGQALTQYLPEGKQPGAISDAVVHDPGKHDGTALPDSDESTPESGYNPRPTTD